MMKRFINSKEMCVFPYGMVPLPSLVRMAKTIRKFRHVQALCCRDKLSICLLSSAEQTNGSWSPINCFFLHIFFTAEGKTSALALSHAKILLGLSCALSLYL